MCFDALFFISCFLPVTAALYALIPGIQGKNSLLLIAGLVFYCFGSLQGLLILLLVSLGNYLMGLAIRRKPTAKVWLVLAVAANLALLGFYKYLDFLLGGVLGLPQLQLGLAAPMGISFFTFKSISYLVDAKRNPEEIAGGFLDFLLYISFFPQITAGPIVRFGDFRRQLTQRTGGTFAPGLRRFVVGLGKKILLAGGLAKIVDAVFTLDAAGLDIRLAWLGAVGYLLQIYFDFSGYSDMAIGLGQMFGFQTAENFRYPYIAASITDFWRRWHISLSAWFRDYVYIPLGGSRRGKARTAWNKLAVFLLCGLWHGAAWTFLLWGVWHGLLSAMESLGWLNPKKWPKALGHIYTLLAVCLGFVVFRAESAAQGLAVIGAMFAGFSFTASGTVVLYGLLTWENLWILLGSAALCLPWRVWIGKREWKWMEPAAYLLCTVLFALCLVKLAAGGFAPFIYAQF